ncbi:hypothetical protein SAMN05421806_1176 [Streptomyces indicus]|uniref:Uncharacterized protein n=2 Tax=Streptomyces indicus TaxID=417292 RepID=A0A1G9GTI0_9ACTN|nr:hypothetical protein SAMN05421806_1176 [Streptomyces indicus]
MAQGVCPGCGSTEVYAGEAYYGQANPNVRLKFGALRGTTVPVSALVCADCGRLEWRLALDGDDREGIRKHFSRVPTR